jgi:hypothetical protein
MAAQAITTPVGRLVGGNVEVLRDKKGNDGKPKLKSDGVTPIKECYFELAIPKEPGHTHWAQTAWGAQIYQIGAAAFPQMHQNPAFAWKIIDGDSAIPNRKGKVPNQNPNYVGHWILKISSGFVPNRYRGQAGAWAQVVEDGVFKLGYYAQVSLQVQGNGSSETPGVYLNPGMVCLRGFGQEIYVGPDVDSAGFGAAPLPPGASAVPVAAATLPAAPGVPGAAPAPLIPGMAAAPAPAAVAPPVPAPAPAVPQLVPVPGAAYSIEACRAANPPWTDDQIVAAGYATRAMPAPAPAPAAAPLPPGFSAPGAAAPAAPIAPVTPIVPNPAFAQIPAPGAPATPAVPTTPQITAKAIAEGTNYAALKQAGWPDDLMRAHGYII